MPDRKKHPRYHIRSEGLEIQYAQYDVLDLLEPGWMMLRGGFCDKTTRAALIRKGWVEVRSTNIWDGPNKVIMVRLTREGMRIRDLVDCHLAERKDRENRKG